MPHSTALAMVGRYGDVLQGQYRGMPVAVKRVLPASGTVMVSGPVLTIPNLR